MMSYHCLGLSSFYQVGFSDFAFVGGSSFIYMLVPFRELRFFMTLTLLLRSENYTRIGRLPLSSFLPSLLASKDRPGVFSLLEFLDVFFRAGGVVFGDANNDNILLRKSLSWDSKILCWARRVSPASGGVEDLGDCWEFSFVVRSFTLSLSSVCRDEMLRTSSFTQSMSLRMELNSLTKRSIFRSLSVLFSWAESSNSLENHFNTQSGHK